MTRTASHRPAVIAGFLGWTLDAFDFFLVVMTLTAIAKEFGKTDAEIAFSITLTLAFRPVGAFIFGLLADRYGRRLPLMIDLVFYSVAEVLTGFAGSYTTFLVLRAIFGIGMGGEWGVGASLVMEKVPAERRGMFSGLLQQGYAAGYLLAALCYFFVFPRWGWRPLFFIGGLPALLALYIRLQVTESEVWQRSKAESWRHLGSAIVANWKIFLYITLLMAMMNGVSHGTQDLYPTFLQRDWGFAPQQKALLTALSMIGALTGGILCGLYFGSVGAPAHDHSRIDRGPRPRSLVGLRAERGVARGGRVPDAVHGPGRVGSDPGAHHRARAGQGPRLPARLRVSVRGVRRQRHAVARRAHRAGPQLCRGDVGHRRDGVRALRHCRVARPRATRHRLWQRSDYGSVAELSNAPLAMR